MLMWSLLPNVRTTRPAATTMQRNSMNYTLICYKKNKVYTLVGVVLLRLLHVKLWIVARSVIEVVCCWKGKRIFPERRINTAESLLQGLHSLTPLFILGLRLMNLK